MLAPMFKKYLSWVFISRNHVIDPVYVSPSIYLIIDSKKDIKEILRYLYKERTYDF